MVFQYLKSGYDKLKSALNKTGSVLGDKLRNLFQSGHFDEENLDKIEQLLYEADLGAKTAAELTAGLKEEKQKNPSLTPDQMMEFLKLKLLNYLSPTQNLDQTEETVELPHLILIVGVNGNGKTTTVAKLTKYYQDKGKKVLIGAADTFRAAAIDQLEVWSTRLGSDLVKGAYQCDPAAVAFDSANAGKARGVDIILIDTAGRLHTKTNLMHELDKIKRSCKKVLPRAPHETLLVLDANTGQNAIDQAKTFMQYTPITGIVLTKMDGSAKGGVVVNIYRQLGLPIKFIGLGENIEDLQPFTAELFVKALFD